MLDVTAPETAKVEEADKVPPIVTRPLVMIFPDEMVDELAPEPIRRDEEV